MYEIYNNYLFFGFFARFLQSFRNNTRTDLLIGYEIGANTPATQAIKPHPAILVERNK